MSKSELLFYNALVSLVPALLFAIVTGEITKVSYQSNFCGIQKKFFFFRHTIMKVGQTTHSY